MLYITNLSERGISFEFVEEIGRFSKAEPIVFPDDILAFPVYLLACSEKRQIDRSFVTGNDILRRVELQFVGA